MSAKFYVLDAREVVGNCALWWRPNGQGYTCDLDEAGVYDEAQTRSMRDTDIPIPVEVANEFAVRHVRLDRLREHGWVKKGRR